MPEDNKAFIRRWFEEVWNKGREEAIDEMFAAEGVANGLVDESGQPLRGPAGFKPFFRKFREAFPEIEVTVEDAIAEGDRVDNFDFMTMFQQLGALQFSAPPADAPAGGEMQSSVD